MTADLAAACPICSAAPRSPCIGPMGAAVSTHITRPLDAKRDTEPCPPPDAEEWLREELGRRVDGDFITSLDPYGDYLEVSHGDGYYARVSGKELAARTLSPGTLSCSSCKRYWTRDSWMQRCQLGAAWPPRCLSCYQTPTASDCAPSPAASAPDAVSSALAPTRGDSGRPVCACGQTIWAELPCFTETVAERRMCADCIGMTKVWPEPAPLDARIAETREPDAVQCAWSSPSSEGESW
jgi:hypothetical protein